MCFHKITTWNKAQETLHAASLFRIMIEVQTNTKVDKDCSKTVVDRIAAGYNIARGHWLRILVHKTTKKAPCGGTASNSTSL